MDKRLYCLALTLALTATLSTGCSKKNANLRGRPSGNGFTGVKDPAVEPIQPELKKLSFVLTNDIHGHLEPAKGENGKVTGGMSLLASYVQHLRALPEYQSEATPLYVLDSGDQFQGTLVSNFDEGKAIFHAFNEVGYDAIVPGNHDYDFGPLGWLYDRVVTGETSNNAREVIEGLAKIAKFPLLSANTYLKATIKTHTANPVELNSSCEPKDQTLRDALDFSTAEHPAFLKPYVISEKSGVRVALIGLDNKFTASTTTGENVSDLCFRDEVEAYLDVRRELEGKADIFVILIHNGNTKDVSEASTITKKINAVIPNGVDLVAAGHTHAVHDHSVNGVHVVQDGSEAKSFGRVDLFFDPIAGRVVHEKTQSWAGQELNPTECKPGVKNRNAFICEQYPLPLANHAAVDTIVGRLRGEIAPLAKKHIATATEKITKHRIDENALSNILTDALRKATGADVSLMNMGGIRTELKKGDIDYETFFEVLPFANKVSFIKEVPWSLLKKLLLKSAQTCNRYGALLFSGLQVHYLRNCVPGTDLDPAAKLQLVKTTSGETILDTVSGLEAAATRTFKVATLDFIATGGSGYEEFRGTRVDADLGIARDIIADQLVADKAVLNNALDGRFKNIAPSTTK